LKTNDTRNALASWWRQALCVAVCLLIPTGLSAQLVRGRVLEAGAGTPVARAIVELRLPSGAVATRGVSGPSGTFTLNAPGAGRYHLRVAAIGYTPHLSPAFEVPAEGVTYGDVRLGRVAVTLAELKVLGTSRCGTGGTGSAVLARLLEGARTSLSVMSGTIAVSGEGFRAEMVRRRSLATRRDSLITADTTVLAPLRWPIQSVGADSLRRAGFMAGEPGVTIGGPVWLGPDVDVLFSDWFLESHCFRVAARSADTATIVVHYEPVIERGRVDIGGTLVLDRTTLALRQLTFVHRNLPAPIRAGTAGGELRFVELPNGAWLPMSWRLYAPTLSDTEGIVLGIEELSGRVLGLEMLGSQPAPARQRLEE
jgi:hypothetical protein